MKKMLWLMSALLVIAGCAAQNNTISPVEAQNGQNLSKSHDFKGELK